MNGFKQNKSQLPHGQLALNKKVSEKKKSSSKFKFPSLPSPFKRSSSSKRKKKKRAKNVQTRGDPSLDDKTKLNKNDKNVDRYMANSLSQIKISQNDEVRKILQEEQEERMLLEKRKSERDQRQLRKAVRSIVSERENICDIYGESPFSPPCNRSIAMEIPDNFHFNSNLEPVQEFMGSMSACSDASILHSYKERDQNLLV